MTKESSQPCAECKAPEECWNYTKEPDPSNPNGKWKIRGWFECFREQPTSVEQQETESK